MKKHILFSFLTVFSFFVHSIDTNAQYGVVVYSQDKDTLCINNINLKNIKHNIDVVSFVCEDTTMTRSITDVKSIDIVKIPDCLVINQGLGDWSEMRLYNDGSIFVTKMVDEDTPSEMIIMCPNDSLGAVFSKVIFDDYGYPTDITMNDYRLKVEWLGETQFNLTLLTPDSIAIIYENLEYTITTPYAGIKKYVPDFGKKGWQTKLGGLFEIAGGLLSFTSGTALVAGAITTGGVFLVPATLLGTLSIADGFKSIYKGYINSFTDKYLHSEYIISK